MYTNLDIRDKSEIDLQAVCRFITPNTNMGGCTQHKIMSLLAKLNKTKKTLVSPSQSRDVPASYIVKPGNTKISV